MFCRVSYFGNIQLFQIKSITIDSKLFLKSYFRYVITVRMTTTHGELQKLNQLTIVLYMEIPCLTFGWL